jgi:hypothetical protein
MSKAIRIAETSNDYPIEFTDDDANRLLDLIRAIQNIAIYDETVLGIIENESAAFFNGDKTAQEVANLIQSKVAIYVAEQS